MTALIKKVFHGITIASFDDAGIVWAHFPAVLKALGHLENESLSDNTRRETARAIWSALDEDERRIVPFKKENGEEVTYQFVSEPGMYHIAAKFDTPLSKSFRRWVTHELVPAYRKGELVRPDVEATGRELAVQIQTIGKALVEAFDRIDKVEEATTRHEVDINELKKGSDELTARVAQLSGQAEFVTVRTRMNFHGLRPTQIQKHAMNVGGLCARLSIERRISLPPKVVEGSYQVNVYPCDVIDEILRNEGLIKREQQ